MMTPMEMNAADAVQAERDDLLALVGEMGGPDFGRAVLAYVRKKVPTFVIFAFDVDDGVGGRVLVAEADNQAVRIHADVASDYARADYLEDSVLQSRRTLAEGSIDMIVQDARDRDSDFREKYFDSADIVQEVSIFNRERNGILYVGFCSRGTAFKPEEIEALQKIAPLISGLLRQHARLLPLEPDDASTYRERRMRAIQRVLERNEAGLTLREAAVCTHIIAGYHGEAIAARLEISKNTVATHRKRAYAKLHISSQTELFRMFVNFAPTA